MSALPEGWAAHQDAEGRTFYANAATGESAWEPPVATYAAAAATPAPYATPDALPAGWAEHLDPGSGQTFYANATTGETAWERPAAPAAAAAAPFTPAAGVWSSDYTYTVGSEGELNALDAAAGGQLRAALLDRNVYSSVMSTINELNSGSVVGVERGYCIMWSNSKQNYFLLWRSDMEYEAFTQLRIKSSEDQVWWSTKWAKALGGLGAEYIFSGKAHLLDTNFYNSCEGAVQALNTTEVPGAFEMGFCVIFSASQQQYFLLYASAKCEGAFAALGLPKESAAAG